MSSLDAPGPSFELATRGSPLSEPTPNQRPSVDPASLAGPGEDRWIETVSNLQAAADLVDGLQQLLLTTAVYTDEPTFSQNASVAYTARALKAQDRRIKVLEREVDAAVLAAARAQARTKDAEVAQRAAEQLAAQAAEDLNNSSVVFESHGSALKTMTTELEKKDEEIRLLKAIIQTLSEKPSQIRSSSRRFS